MWKAIENGWIPPKLITEDEYVDINKNRDSHLDCLIGYVGFNLSFGAKFFGGYRRDVAGQKGNLENMITQSRRAYEAIIKQAPLIKGIKFYNGSYIDLDIPDNSIIYCDPPYKDTTKYKSSEGGFDHEIFWEWVRILSESNQVFVSEYTAPDDFECIWQKEVNSSLTKETGAKKAIEKLFVYKHRTQ